MSPKLGFGAAKHVPHEVTCAWGARLIWPDDLVYNRQDMIGSDDDRKALAEWLNGGALKYALTEARRMADAHEVATGDDQMFTLLDCSHGTIVGNPQASYGYLYVAAWLK
jgi:hypothetical protein